MSFTPGPWTYKALGHANDDTSVGCIQGPDDLVADAVLENDANLIAAAPELLEGAKKLIGIYDSYGTGWYGQQECVDALNAFRAAIAKAEGTHGR